ncbi:MAG TPA: carboxypeptidase-like regulatory domain-containing protein, partial [Mucilaginibacter sp.]
MNRLFIFLLFLSPLGCLAQINISGRVLNGKDKTPVADASVFLSNATIGGNTNKTGIFKLNNVKPGKYELIVSIVGFEVSNTPITVENKNTELPDILLIPKSIALKEVTIKYHKDPNRDLYYELFKKQFLGTSDRAGDSKILNPDVLDLDYDGTTNQLTASSYDFLEIENDALGYKIKYLVKHFVFNTNSRDIYYEGPALFTEMEGTPKQQHRWLENRKKAYEGSMMDFLHAAMNDALGEEGFKVLRIVEYPNPERPPDDLITAKINKFSARAGSDHNTDSLSYWKKKAALPKTLRRLMTTPLTKADIIKKTSQPGIFSFGGGKDVLLIEYDKSGHFIKTKSIADLPNLNFILNKPDNKKLTLLSFDGSYAEFDSNYWISNPGSVSIRGVLGLNRVADLLPIDYEGVQNTVQADNIIKDIKNKIDTFAASHITEKVHLHTDRPWYGLGDTIWFKAYTVAGTDHRPSNLSGVLYTELINEKDSVVNRMTLPLDAGISDGDFILPYTYKSGIYRLRAYTRLMLNDSSKFYDQKIIIGGINLQADQNAGTNGKPNLSVNNSPQKEHNNPDVQFFPEGGNLVNGLLSKVAVKATNSEGLAENIQGTITDQDGHEATSFNIQHSGMGQFQFMPQPGKQYKAKIICADGSNFTADLPKPEDTGFTLTVNNAADSIYVKVAANDLFYKNNSNSTFYIVAQCGDKCYYTATGKLTKPLFIKGVDKTRFPTGIVRFTLFSQKGEPLNERIVFVQNNDGLKLALSSPKQNYAPTEKVKIDLDAKKDDHKTISGSFSVAVTDETKVPVDEASEPTIFTDLLLSPELKGYIENPNYYFINQDDKTRADLDLLMLTQGYRKFDWKRILTHSNPQITANPEIALSLSGTIKTLSNKPVANGKIRLTSIKDHFSADTTSDINGNFKFTNLNFDDTTKVIINAQQANGGKNVSISIKQPTYAAVNKTGDINYLRESLHEPVLSALRKTYLNGQQQSSKNTIQLKEVKIKSKRDQVPDSKYSDNMRLSANLNGPGNADQVILGDDL